MATILAFHEVDDHEHWLRSPKREEVFGPLASRAGSSPNSDYFHSENPVEAAGFVLSDAVALLWEFIRDQHGLAAFADWACHRRCRADPPATAAISHGP